MPSKDHSDPPQSIANNSSDLPALPEEDTAELIALNRLSALPPAHAQELHQRAQPCDDSDWGLFLPPASIPTAIVGVLARTACLVALRAPPLS